MESSARDTAEKAKGLLPAVTLLIITVEAFYSSTPLRGRSYRLPVEASRGLLVGSSLLLLPAAAAAAGAPS